MIEIFPVYSPIDTSLTSDIQELTSRFPPYSDFSVANLLCWDRDGQGLVSLLNGNLVLRYPDYLHTGEHFVSFMGDNEVDETVKVLLDEAETHSTERSLRLVPEVGAQALNGTGVYQAIEDRDSTDYIVSMSALKDLEGKSLYRFRRAVRTFELDHAEKTDFKQLDLNDPRDQDQIRDVFMKRESNKDHNDSANELDALNRLLSLGSKESLVAFGLEIQDKLEAFIICELNGDWAIGHFWKAQIEFKGIYSYLMCATASQLAAFGVNYMNTQQDLGMPGLRQFKQSMRPVQYLKKYTIMESHLIGDSSKSLKT